MITVIAGVNGAGKSSVVGSNIRAKGGEYFNPDEYTQALLTNGKASNLDEANSMAWKDGRDQLEKSITNNLEFTFETTLGGNSITQLLIQGVEAGIEVSVIYVGLDHVDKHIERVKARVENGGHDIPEDKIRSRYASSCANLALLVEKGLQSLAVYDNSATTEQGASPTLEFMFYENSWYQKPTAACKRWAKPIALSAIKRGDISD